ncbi:MAG: hypothetical protein AAGI23_18455 [Bacteroidota bacterium]
MLRLILILLIPISLDAQTLTQFRHWQNDFSLSWITQSIDDNRTLVGGTFRNQFQTREGQNFDAIGGSDIVLLQLSENGNTNWVSTGGSDRNDVLVATAQLEGQTFATGTYWLNGNFGAINLTTSGSPQGIFLVNYDESGVTDWGLSINGEGDKEVNDMVVDDSGNLYLTGSFNGSLWLASDTLDSPNGTSLFVLKFNRLGELIWAQQNQTQQGTARGTAMTILSNNDVAILGEWVGKTAFLSDTLQTDTEDADIFLANYSSAGEEQWVREAGGVFPSFAVDIVSGNDQIFVTGNFVGRIEFSESMTIESLGVNEDIFLLSYDLTGQPLWAKRIGATNNENVRSLAIHENRLLLGGFFRETFTADDIILNGSANANGFMLQTDLSGNALWGSVIRSTGNVLVNKVQALSDREWRAIGDFTGTISLSDNQSFVAPTFNPFLATFQDRSSSTFSPTTPPLDFTVIQNDHTLVIETDFPIESIRLFDVTGRLIRIEDIGNILDISNLLSGTYAIFICGTNGSCGSRLIVTR